MARFSTTKPVKTFTNKRAEQNLARAEKLFYKAEQLREQYDGRTKEGRAAREEARKLEAQAEKLRQRGLEIREEIRRQEEYKRKEYNATIYNMIQAAMLDRRAKLQEMTAKGTRGRAGNEQLMDVIDMWEDRLFTNFEGVVDEVYAAFEEAYNREPSIFDAWIYYSEGTMITESWMVLEEILNLYADTEETDIRDDDTFEETY